MRLESKEWTLDDLWALPDPEMLVEGFIEEGSCKFISGPPKTGKSFCSLRLAAAVSSGADFFGHATKQGNVLYLAAERSELMKRRTLALVKSNIPIDKDHFKVWPSPVMFSQRDQVETFVNSLRTTPDFLIVDTLRRCNDGDERDNEHMGRWCEGIEYFRDLTGSSVLVVHHDHKAGIDKMGRKLDTSFSGAGAILGYLDGYFALKPQNDGSIIVRNEGENEKSDFQIHARIKNVDLSPTMSTGIMIQINESSSAPKPNLAFLAIEVLGDQELSRKEWHRQCVADERIAKHWPKLDASTMTDIAKELPDAITSRKNPKDGREVLFSVAK